MLVGFQGTLLQRRSSQLPPTQLASFASTNLEARACSWHHFKKVAVMSAINLMAMFQDGRCFKAVA